MFICLFVICGSGDGAEFDGMDVIVLLLLWVMGGFDWVSRLIGLRVLMFAVRS